MKIYLLAVTVLALSGCAGSGTKIDAAQLDEVRRGQTTVADIVRRFGRPNFFSKNWDGTQTAAYAHSDGRSDAGTLLPLMGAVVAGAEAGVDSVIFNFDANGVLTDYRTTQAAAAGSARASVAEPAQAGSGVPAQTGINKPARTGPDTTQRDDGLPFWLPSRIRDPRQ
jgi:outer membrane protein assembly factor BamE (lipoprotein component of BamABCDE complex)